MAEFIPEPNFFEVTSDALNIVPGASGSVMKGGAMQSLNFSVGISGWRILANGDVEFGSGKFRGDITGASGTFSGTITATAGSIGGFNIGADYMRDAANSMGMASTVTGVDDVRFWAGDTFANRATAPFRVTEAGAVTASSFTHSGGTVGASVVVAIGALNVAARGWTQTSIFSVTDSDTVAWAAGTFTSADGTSYSIGAGNTGNMAAATYIYLDTAVSTTAYQTTTTAATAVGAGKVLVAKAQNGTGEATFQVFGGIGGTNIDAASIVAGSITANELSTSITYAGSIVIDTAGLIRSGQTAYNTGTGWWLGNDSGTPKFSIGISTGNRLTWDGTTLTVVGNTAPPYFDVSLFGTVFGQISTDRFAIVTASTTTVRIQIPSQNINAIRQTTSDWVDVDGIVSAVLIGTYLYLLLIDTGPNPDVRRVYRYDVTNMVAGGTIITFSGATTLTDLNNPIVMGSDGTFFYFTRKAGNSSGNDYELAKYSFSGTTFTYNSTITCGSTAGFFLNFSVRPSDGHIMGLDDSVGTMRRYNASGTLQATSPYAYGVGVNLQQIASDLYLGVAGPAYQIISAP